MNFMVNITDNFNELNRIFSVKKIFYVVAQFVKVNFSFFVSRCPIFRFDIT